VKITQIKIVNARLCVLGNRVLRTIFGLKRDERIED
jgi:hypothetical protein